MNPGIEFPDMRLQVIEALTSLGDIGGRQSLWGVYGDDAREFDSFDICIHILYDDCQVLPDPASKISVVIYEGEVAALVRLENELGPLLSELGDSSESEYMEDPRWQAVVRAARTALDVMRLSDV